MTLKQLNDVEKVVLNKFDDQSQCKHNHVVLKSNF